MRIKLKGVLHGVHAIEKVGDDSFRVFTSPGLVKYNSMTMRGQVLGDALRERYDELEAQGGDQDEMKRLAEAIRMYRV